MSIDEVARLVNIILSVVVMILMGYQMWVWRRLPEEWRIVGLGMGALVVATAIAAAENLAEGNPIGIRVPLTTIALGWLAFGLSRVHRTIGGGKEER